MDSELDEIIALRRELHRHPENSACEFDTAKRIERFIARYEPDRVIPVAETGRIFEFSGREEGPAVLFRADLDALPIQEQGDLPYRSTREGVAHLCGHDGHMAILTALAARISRERPRRGRALLLFQPDEETGRGAERVVMDPAFSRLAPDRIFGLHNIPGVPHNQVVLRRGTFAAASQGMIIDLEGRTSHAGEPEHGLNPVHAMGRLIPRIEEIRQAGDYRDFTLITIIHLRLGDPAFGTSPGTGAVMLTLRSYTAQDMDLLVERVESAANRIAGEEGLRHSIRYTEIFPALVNDDSSLEMVEQAAAELPELTLIHRPEPFRWSEDFAYLLQAAPGAFFGLGSGTDQPDLHSPDYDFPDELIGPGSLLFHRICRRLLG